MPCFCSIQELRSELDRLLILKIGSPQLELYQPHTSNQTPESKLMQAIIDLITREDTTEQAVSLLCSFSEHMYVLCYLVFV